MSSTHHDIIAGHDVSLSLGAGRSLLDGRGCRRGRTLTNGGVVVKKGRKGRGTGFIGPGPTENNDGIVLAACTRLSRGLGALFFLPSFFLPHKIRIKCNTPSGGPVKQPSTNALPHYFRAFPRRTKEQTHSEGAASQGNFRPFLFPFGNPLV
jgi:hypothetical protein